MQVMKSDAATVGMKHGICEQVIHVHQHRREEDQPVFFPVVFVIPVCNGTNENEVEEVMYKNLNHKTAALLEPRL